MLISFMATSISLLLLMILVDLFGLFYW